MTHLGRSLPSIVVDLAISSILLLPTASSAADPALKKGDVGKIKQPSPLRMSRAVVCRTIDGFEQYEPLGDVGLTSDEKLLVYFRPDGYKIAQRGQDRFVHFSQDGKILRRGEKVPVRIKLKLLDLESEGRNPPPQIFLRNTVSLKDLPPGEYDFEIILRDENAPGVSATQTVAFRIVRAKAVDVKSGDDAKEEPASRKDAGKPRD